MPNKHNMPKYQGTKELYAVAMSRGDYNKLRGWDLPANEKYDDPGYLVEYIDGGTGNHPDYEGYISWSPADVFNVAYKVTESAHDRVKIELDQLNTRKYALADFLGSGRAKEVLTDFHYSLLGLQFRAMYEYSEVLEKREGFMGEPQDACNYGEFDRPALFKDVDWPFAQRAALEGFPITRAGWNGKNQFVSCQPAEKLLSADKFWIPANKRAAEANGGEMGVSPYFSLKTAQNKIQMGWIPSSGDLFANDWVVLFK